MINVESCTYMGGFAQFGFNQFKRGRKVFSQLQLSEDTDTAKELNICVQFAIF